jgi:hypothetical protein
MPDGSNSPDAPITIHVDGDIKALPFIADLKRAGLRLVQEGGKTFLRKQEERDELPDTITEALDDAKEALNRAEIADALELIERAERVIKRQEAWLKFALERYHDAKAIVTLAADALNHGDDCTSEAAFALNDYAWPRMHKGHRAIGFALQAIDPAAVENMSLEVAWDEQEREMIDRIDLPPRLWTHR